MPASKIKFNADDRRLLSREDRLAIKLGKITQEEAVGVIGARGVADTLAGPYGPGLMKARQDYLVAEELERNFPTPAPLEPITVKSNLKAPTYFGTGITPLSNFAHSANEGVGNLATRTMKLLPGAIGSDYDPAKDAGVVGDLYRSLDAGAAYSREKQEQNAFDKQRYTSAIQNKAVRALADFSLDAPQILPNALSIVFGKRGAAVTAGLAGLGSLNQALGAGVPFDRALLAAAADTGVEYAFERTGGVAKTGVGTVLKEGLQEGGTYLTQVAEQAAQAATISPELKSVLPKTFGDLAYNATKATALGSLGGATIGLGARAAQNYQAQKAEEAKSAADLAKMLEARATKRARDAFDPIKAEIPVTGMNADFDAGIVAGNALVAQYAGADVSTDISGILEGQRKARANPKEQLELNLPPQEETVGQLDLNLPPQQQVLKDAYEQLGLPLPTQQPRTLLEEQLTLPFAGQPETGYRGAPPLPLDPVLAEDQAAVVEAPKSLYEEQEAQGELFQPPATSDAYTRRGDLVATNAPLSDVTQPRLFEAEEAQGELFNTPPPAPLAAAEQVEPSLPTDPTLAPLPVRGRDFGVTTPMQSTPTKSENVAPVSLSYKAAQTAVSNISSVVTNPKATPQEKVAAAKTSVAAPSTAEEDEDGSGVNFMRAAESPGDGDTPQSAPPPKTLEWAKKNLNFTATNGTPAWRNFAQWFGNSKASDKNGVPLRVHHGTAASVDAFDPSKRGKTTGAPSAKAGFFFTDRRKSAEYYAKVAEREAASAASNRIDAQLARAYRSVGNEARAVEAESRIANRAGPNVVDAHLSIQNPLVHDFKGKGYREESYNDLIETARANGHDGVILKNTFDAGETGRIDALLRGRIAPETIYVVFDPTQIKSATANDGNYGVTDPRITRMAAPAGWGSVNTPPTKDDVRKDIANDRSEFGNIARKGLKDGRIRLLTKDEAEIAYPNNRALGWYDTAKNEVVIVVDRTGKVGSIAVVAHEVTHAGLERMKREKYPQYVARIRQLAAEGNQQAIEALASADKQQKLALAGGTDSNTVAKQLPGEIVSHTVHTVVMARDGGKPTGRLGAVVADIKSTVKATLHELGYLDTSWLDLDDIVRLSSRNADAFLTKTNNPAKPKPVKAPLPKDTAGPFDPATSIKELRPSSSGLLLPKDNPNRSKKDNDVLKGTTTQSRWSKMLLGLNTGTLQPLLDRATGIPVDSIFRAVKSLQRLQQLGVTDEMIEGMHTGVTSERSAAFRKIKALKNGAEAYVIAAGLKKDMGQMSYNIAVLQVGGTFNPDGTLDRTSLSPENLEFVMDVVKNVNTYAARTYEMFVSKESKEAWQKATWGDYSKGIKSEGSARIERAINAIVANELLLPADPKWPEAHPETVERMATNWGIETTGKTTAELVAELTTIQNSKTMLEYRDKAENMVKELLDLANTVNSVIVSYHRGRTADLSNLKARTNVPDYMKDLWGEVKDPAFNLVNTYAKLAELSTSLQLASQLEQFGLREGIVEDKKGGGTGKLTELINGDQFGALNGKYTTPHFYEILKASRSAPKDKDPLTDAMTRRAFSEAGQVLAGKVVGVHQSVVRMLKGATLLTVPIMFLWNVASAPAFLAQSGNYSPKAIGKGIAAAYKFVRAHGTGKFTYEEVSELIKGGILDSVQTGDIRDTESRLLADLARQSLNGSEKFRVTAKRKAGSAYVATRSLVQDMYAVMDLWSKFANYYKEKDYFVRLYKEKGVAITPEELQLLAADRTNMTNPTYARSNPVVRALDINGVLPFATFTAEIPRTTGNSLFLGMRDLNEGIASRSKVQAADGAKRIVGALAMPVYYGKLVGFAATLGYGAIKNLDDDEENDEAIDDLTIRALKEMFTKWGGSSDQESKEIRGGLGNFLAGTEMIRLEDAESTNPRFINLSRANPYDFWITPFMAALREEGGTGKQWEKFTSLQRTASAKMLDRLMVSFLWSGKDPPLKKDAPKFYAWAQAASTNLSRGAITEEQLDLFLRTFEKFKMFSNPVKAGEAYAAGDISKAVDKAAGGAVMEFDPVIGLSKHSPAILLEAKDVSTKALKQASREGVNDETRGRLVLKSYDAQFRAFNSARTIVIAAQAAGMSSDDIVSNLTAAKVSEDMAYNLISGDFVPTEVESSKTFLKEKNTTDKDPDELEEKRQEKLYKLQRALDKVVSDKERR